MAPLPISSINVGHIDDVIELRKTKPETIPQRFVRDMTERSATAKALSPPHNDMPVINFSTLSKGSSEQLFSELLKLATACEEWGFFQVNTSWPFILCYYYLITV